MHFLVPAFAFFTVLCGIPVAIHLIGRSRAKVVPFPAMAFLLAGHRKVARRTTLRQLMLLLLRAAVMAALPLCLAKPFVEALSDLPIRLGGAQSLVVVLDDSLPMSYRLGTGSLLDRAKERAGRLIDALDRDSDAALVLGSRGSSAPVAELTSDRARLLRALSAVDPTYHTTDLSAAVKRAAQILSGGRGIKRIYLFSDLSAHALDPALVPPADIEIVPIDVSAGKPLPNRALVDLRVEPAPSLGRSGVRITAEVANFGDQPIKELPVTLTVDGKAVARGLVDLAARGRAVKRFYHVLGHVSASAPDPGLGDADNESRNDRPGAHSRRRGQVAGQQLSDDPAPAGIHDVTMALSPDDLPADDMRTLRVEVQRTLKVLVIDGEPRGLRREDEVFYLEMALRPGDREDSQVDATTSTVDELGSRPLGDYDAIFLCNVKATDLTRVHLPDALRDYLNGGGGLFMALGENVDADAYNRILGDILPQPLSGTKTAGPVRRSSGVTPGEGPARTGRPDDAGQPGRPDSPEASLDPAGPIDSTGDVHEATQTGAGERLGRFDRRHPLMLPFSGGHSVESLYEARFGRYMLLRPTLKAAGSEGSGVTTLLSFDTGAPALIEKPVGAGRVLLFTSSLDRDWNDLPIQPAFLPLMQQAARYLSRAPMREADPSVLVGQRHEIKLRDGDLRVEVTLPSGRKRLFEADRVKGRHLLGFTDTDEPGLYRVAVAQAGFGGGLRPRPAEFFAVNVDPAESDLRRATPARIAALSRPLGNAADNAAPRRRVELWHALGALLLFLLLGEALLLGGK